MFLTFSGKRIRGESIQELKRTICKCVDECARINEGLTCERDQVSCKVAVILFCTFDNAKEEKVEPGSNGILTDLVLEGIGFVTGQESEAMVRRIDEVNCNNAFIFQVIHSGECIQASKDRCERGLTFIERIYTRKSEGNFLRLSKMLSGP
jgi:hypothetical protein